MNQIASGVFLGVVMAAGFIWAMSRAARYKTDGDIPWIVYAGLLVPILFFIGTLVIAGDLPPPLAALVAQATSAP